MRNCPISESEAFHIAKMYAYYPHIHQHGDFKEVWAVQMLHPMSEIRGRTLAEIKKAIPTISMTVYNNERSLEVYLESHLNDLYHEIRTAQDGREYITPDTINVNIGTEKFTVRNAFLKIQQ